MRYNSQFDGPWSADVKVATPSDSDANVCANCHKPIHYRDTWLGRYVHTATDSDVCGK